MTKFSKYFNLNKDQSELDFVDIPLKTDIPLFIDPAAVTNSNNPWMKYLHNIIIDYFELLMKHIKTNDDKSAKYLLSELGEINDTHLGYSKNEPSGKSIGGDLANSLLNNFKYSKAAKTGILSDIGDAVLFIDNISTDRISDWITKIIKFPLIEYTQRQCELLNIPTKNVASGIYWDADQKEWNETYQNLPVIENKRIILVPKILVKRIPTINIPKYYDNFVISYLQLFHLKTNSDLVTTLKTGKRIVKKKDLKELDKYRPTKKFLNEITVENPEILQDFHINTNIVPITNSEIKKAYKKATGKSLVTKTNDELKSELKQINTGKKDAYKYHDFITGLVVRLFYPNLTNIYKEMPKDKGLKFIDIFANNVANQGFFKFLLDHKYNSSTIVFECKNYSSDPGNPEVDQVAGRFSVKSGNVGFLICRKFEDRDRVIERCRNTLNNQRGLIIPLEDKDIFEMIDNTERLREFLLDRYNEIVM